MVKKILQSFLILLACALLFFSICVVVLFLAPGVEIFGIRYVAKDIANFYTHKTISTIDPTNGFDGSIYIETYGVPVELEFVPTYAVDVSFREDFVGLTKTKEKRAGCQIDVINGELKIITTEIVPWVYRHKTEDNYYLNVKISSTIKDANIVIKSTNSKVNVTGNPRLNSFELSTTSSLTLSEGSTLHATNFKYHTEKEVTIGNKITCENADLYSKANNINVVSALEGDLKAETRGGSIKFVSCKSLDAVTASGNISRYGEGLNSVGGEVNITTRSGNIALGNVGGEGGGERPEFLKIVSKTGIISINSMKDGEFTLSRGRLSIGSARSIIVNSKTGDVKVNSVEKGIVINSNSGSVELGSGGSVNNPYVRTDSGAVEVYGALGTVDIASHSNSVFFENGLSTSIKLNSGRKLTAKRLMGKVEAVANGDVEMSFDQTPTQLDLQIKSKGSKANIDMTCTPLNAINYNIQSTKGKKAKLYSGSTLISENSIITSGITEELPMITIKSVYAVITVLTA